MYVKEEGDGGEPWEAPAPRPCDALGEPTSCGVEAGCEWMPAGAAGMEGAPLEDPECADKDPGFPLTCAELAEADASLLEFFGPKADTNCKKEAVKRICAVTCGADSHYCAKAPYACGNASVMPPPPPPTAPPPPAPEAAALCGGGASMDGAGRCRCPGGMMCVGNSTAEACTRWTSRGTPVWWFAPTACVGCSCAVDPAQLPRDGASSQQDEIATTVLAVLLVLVLATLVVVHRDALQLQALRSPKPGLATTSRPPRPSVANPLFDRAAASDDRAAPPEAQPTQLYRAVAIADFPPSTPLHVRLVRGAEYGVIADDRAWFTVRADDGAGRRRSPRRPIAHQCPQAAAASRPPTISGGCRHPCPSRTPSMRRLTPTWRSRTTASARRSTRRSTLRSGLRGPKIGRQRHGPRRGPGQERPPAPTWTPCWPQGCSQTKSTPHGSGSDVPLPFDFEIGKGGGKRANGVAARLGSGKGGSRAQFLRHWK